ncbi:MAG: hypothetical protein J7518_03200 [Nocardioidaceae bacterium]|nr:hypothetical protein [Nocardioidaceae bacterium]
MDELGGALRELARQAHAPTPVDPAALWARGRTRVRRRRMAVAATAVVLAVLGSLAVIRPEPRAVMPAGAPHAPAIPKNIYEPNRFLAGVSKAGPPGRLAVIAAHGWREGGGPWFGISATTGRYSELDLPDLASGGPMRLSPDGLRIAYWITGPTRKKDFGPRTRSSAGGPLPDKPLAGVAVYDTRNGSVVRHRILSDYGLDSDAQVSWLDDDTIAFSYSVATGTNSGRSAGAYRWTPGSSAPVTIPGQPFDGARYVPAFPPIRLVHNNDDATPYVVTDTRARPTGMKVVTPGTDTVPNAVTFSRRWVVELGTMSSPAIDRVFAGPRGRDNRAAALAPIGTIVLPRFLGWQSDARIVVFANPGRLIGGRVEMAQSQDPPRYLYEVDLDARKVRRLGTIDADLPDVSIQVARTLLAHPMVLGRRPPSLLEVFRVPLTVGGITLLAGAAWIVVRRRRRA